MVMLLHGASGGLDEIAIGVVAFGVLWIAVKLAGRKPAGDDDDEQAANDEQQQDLEKSTPTMKSN